MSERDARARVSAAGPGSPVSGGPPLRALAMLLIALAIVFAGVGIFSLSGSGSGDSTAAVSATTSAASAAPAGAPAPDPASPGAPVPDPAAAGAEAAAASTPAATSGAATSGALASAVTAPDKAVPVRVLNASDIAGLAARTAQQLTGAGWTVAETGNYVSSAIASTTVYYGNSTQEKAAAEAIAGKLGATAAPRFGAIANLGQGVVVIVTH